MIRVRISTNFDHWPLERQTPGATGQWGNLHCFANKDVEECDFWVIFDGLSRPETTRCHRSNTLLITGEPPDIKIYPRDFIAQFGAVLTSHRGIDHRNVVVGQQALPWMIGAQLEPVSHTWANFMSFEEIERYSVRKERLVSVVASKGKWTPGHAARDKFIEELTRTLPNQIEVFGLGYRPVVDKLDAIGPYRYHIVVENQSFPDYWTEKLADAYLGRAFPIYSGCPNLENYFPAGSFERIDIANPEGAACRVAEIIASNTDVHRQAQLEEARRKVLYEYNVFAVLDALIPRLQTTTDKTPEPLTLCPQRPPAPPSLFERLQRKFRRLIATPH